MLCCVVLHCVVLCCVALYCIVLCCVVLLYCIILYCIILYCIVLYCISPVFLTFCTIELYKILIYMRQITAADCSQKQLFSLS